MVRVPINASYEVQTAIQDINSELEKLRLLIDSKRDSVSLRALDEMGAKVSALSSKPNTLDFNDVFRGSGPAHAIGYVPDPGITAGTSRYLNENGQWVTPVVVYYVADSLTVTTGTATGNVTHTRVQGDGNVLHIDEVTGTPGFNLILDFVDIVSPNFLIVHSYYNGNHHPAVQMYNYNSASWDELDTYDDAATLQGRVYTLTSNYVDGSGNARVRFYHSSSGSASHDLFVDYVAIQSGGLNPATVDHGVLGGLDDLDHPASAIINDSGVVGATAKDALDKLNFSARALGNVTAATGNSGSGETTVMTLTLPANTLSADGMALRFDVGWRTAANANTKTVKAYLGSGVTTLYSAAGNNLTHYQVLFLSRDSSTTALFSGYRIDNSAGPAAIFGQGQLTGMDHTTDQTVKVTVQGTSTNDVIVRLALVTLLRIG